MNIFGYLTWLDLLHAVLQKFLCGFEYYSWRVNGKLPCMRAWTPAVIAECSVDVIRPGRATKVSR